MGGARGNVYRLVLREQELLVSPRHLAGAAHHHPVLEAVAVHLQGERLARLHAEALDLVALAGAESLEAAPGALDPAVMPALLAAFALEPGDDLARLARGVLVRHEHRVRGLDHHRVPEAHRGEQAMFRVQKAARAVADEHVAVGGVVSVAALEVQPGGPGADVGPARVQGHHRWPVSAPPLVHRRRGSSQEPERRSITA